jgi:hypothetical protein
MRVQAQEARTRRKLTNPNQPPHKLQVAQRQPGNDFAISKRIVQWVRDALLAGVHLAAPDFARPFHLQTDASEDGKGAVLYQLLGCPVAQQYPYCSDKHSPTNMAMLRQGWLATGLTGV